MHTRVRTVIHRRWKKASTGKTVETVGIPRQVCRTQLKLGVNERKPRCAHRKILCGVIVTWTSLMLAASVCRGATNEFQGQLITLPFHANAIQFIPLEEHGRAALLAVDPVQHRLLIYRQRPWGFTNVADQVLPLPPCTAWVAPCDVDPHPGLELVVSSATGISYHRENNGRFEPELRSLINAGQVFTNDDIPRLLSLATNTSLPVIAAMTQAVLYARNGAYEWQPAEPVDLKQTQSGWSDYRQDWTLGQNRSRGLSIHETFRAGPKEPVVRANDAIRKLVEELRKDTTRPIPGTNSADINHDGKMDFVLWQVIPALEPRTDVYLFMAGADGRLPDKPTQVLHCRGVPIPLDSTEQESVLADLKRDGNSELILMEINSPLTSGAGILEMALSMGIDCGLAIRTFHDGAFSVAPDARIPCTLLIGQQLQHWPVFVCGDINGDGRPDLLVQRSTTQWNIFLSTPGDSWFTAQPAITFETPLPGYLTIEDINGDGRADIVVRQSDDPRIHILLSRTRSADKP